MTYEFTSFSSQQYLSYIKTMCGLKWKAMCNRPKRSQHQAGLNQRPLDK